MTVADCGVAADSSAAVPRLIHMKVPGAEYGSADASRGPALSETQCKTAIAGPRAGQESGLAMLLLGEMGIANSLVAALLMAMADRRTAGALWVAAPDSTTSARHGNEPCCSVRWTNGAGHHATAVTLAAFGGLEIASMVGAAQQAAAEGRVIVVDGFYHHRVAIAVAAHCKPALRQRSCVFAHCSSEAGHDRWLQHLACNRCSIWICDSAKARAPALAWLLLESACRMLERDGQLRVRRREQALEPMSRSAQRWPTNYVSVAWRCSSFTRLPGAGLGRP
ncbi:MAG: nicotinate-nucleotide--dimethylbenzimidazole phosphoribosyltransferase [Sinobacteraceae bacterium]|nr:nicotinate-nucleotide--dimethylbenzimidazole phosphoribosyltransferase [Nevskiaceae bacterium]